MPTRKTDLEVHSVAAEHRLYSAFAVNMRDMRLALQRLASRLRANEEGLPPGLTWDRYAEMCLEAKISGCKQVYINQERRTLFVQATDPDGATYNYSAPLPPQWPKP